MARDTSSNQDTWMKEQYAFTLFQMSVLEKTPIELVINHDQATANRA